MNFDHQLRAAIRKYGDESIDISISGDDVYGFFHSPNNSFAVTDTYSLKALGGLKSILPYEEEFERLCVCTE